MRILIAAIFVISLFWLFGTEAWAQTGSRCRLAGPYRINVKESDRLYSAVEDAVSKVPFREQQQFFFDLSVRLTPPDILALDCSRNRVSVASSRARKVTFTADGITRNERSAGGGMIRSRIELAGDSLSFSSGGKTQDRIDVSFQSFGNGRRLRVVGSIFADQHAKPVVIRTIYDKLSDEVEWDIYENRTLATSPPKNQNPRTRARAEKRVSENRANEVDADRLNTALDEWIATTNGRNIVRQMSFYMPELEAFYLARKAPASLVRREKNQVFAAASKIDIRADEPEFDSPLRILAVDITDVLAK